MDHPLLQSLFDDHDLVEEPQPQTVTELNADVRSALETRFAKVWVEGEITGFHAHSSGHWYFSLTDGTSIIKATCFRQSNFRIRFRPNNGLHVRVRGRVTTYEKRGEYQLSVDSLEPVGEGALTVAFEQIKAKLHAEGLFEPEAKRSLPAFPRRVGLVTSRDGAALYDILSVLERRARSVRVALIPVAVQGESAGRQIARAIELANRFCEGCMEDQRIDVLIVGRGGGSAEDLWAFNEEIVARAIRGSQIPVISAVGHEVDVTIADMAADVRAPTPSAAAEIVARAEEEIKASLRTSVEKMQGALVYRLLKAQGSLHALETSRAFADVPLAIQELRRLVGDNLRAAEDAFMMCIDAANERLKAASHRLSPVSLARGVDEKRRLLSLLEQRQNASIRGALRDRLVKLDNRMAQLDALSPLSVLNRGYSITQKRDGAIVRNTHQTEAGESLRIRVSDGTIDAEVISMQPGEQ